MHRSSHRATPRRPLRMVLATFQGASLGGLLTLVVLGGMHAASSAAHQGATPGSRTPENEAYQQVIARAVTDHDCSYTGFGNREIPASALIQNARGEVRQVSFDVGWDVYNGKRPGTLIAVCHDETRGNELVSVSNHS